MLHASYGEALIQERAQVLETTAAIVQGGERPHVYGLVPEYGGESSKYQGLSYRSNTDGVFVGLHVVDPGIMPVAGAYETHAYTLQRGTSGSELVGDPVLRKNLRLSKRPLPVLSFYFETSGTTLEPAGIERSVFEYKDNPWQALDIAEVLLPFSEELRKDDENPLSAAQRRMTKSVNRYAKDFLTEHGLPALSTDAGPGVSRPLHEWTHLKSGQWVGMLLDGDIPLYTQAQLRAMQLYAIEESDEAKQRDIAPANVGEQAKELLLAPDIRGHVLSDDEYAELLTAFDPEEHPDGEYLLVNVMNWALRQGLVTSTAVGESAQEFAFHNLDSTIRVCTPEGDLTPQTAFDALHKLLAYRARSREEARRVGRGQLAGLKHNVGRRLGITA